MPRFKSHYDRDLQAEITSPRQRERVMEERGVCDLRDWDSHENFQKEVEKNREEATRERNAYLREPVKKALQRAKAGDDPIPELERELEEHRAREAEAQEREERAAAERAAEEAERAAWAARRG